MKSILLKKIEKKELSIIKKTSQIIFCESFVKEDNQYNLSIYQSEAPIFSKEDVLLDRSFYLILSDDEIAGFLEVDQHQKRVQPKIHLKKYFKQNKLDQFLMHHLDEVNKDKVVLKGNWFPYHEVCLGYTG